MIDTLKDELIPISRMKLLGCKRHRDTIRRWVVDGVICRATGETVKLEAAQVGGSLYTTRAAYKRFLDDLNPT